MNRFRVADLIVLSAVAAVVVALGLSSGHAGRRFEIAVGDPAAGAGRAVPRGFLGVSLEYPAVLSYAGSDPAALDPVFVQLVRQLEPGGGALLRIGGDSSDWTWWPVPGITRPPGVRFTLTSRWLAVTRALVAALPAHVLLGLNLEADSGELAAAEAGQLLAGLGRENVRALELGNEPDLYGNFAWYRTASGAPVRSRPAAYDFPSFLRDFKSVAAALPRFPLAGPATNAPAWRRWLTRFVESAPSLGLVTAHRYPLQRCFVGPRSPRYPSVANLLAPGASRGLARVFAPYVRVTRAHGLSLRVDELNTVACGAAPRISESFAAALWVVDALFRMLRTGVSGVNMHTFPGAGYELFRFRRVGGRWSGWVAPEYYGLLLFARAAPAGSRLMTARGRWPVSLHVWATRGLDGAVRVSVINVDQRHARTVALRVAQGGAGRVAALERLLAPSASATGGVTLGGRTLGASTYSGVLAPPRRERVSPDGDRYVVRVPPASAALLIVPGQASAS